jgi:hypothetical protein
MKAILINPELKQVSQIEIGSDYREIYAAIECNIFSAPVTFENEDTLYCDDEGLFKRQKGGTLMKDWNYPILGKMIIIGSDDEGESVDCKSTVEEIESLIVRWLDENESERYATSIL